MLTLLLGATAMRVGDVRMSTTLYDIPVSNHGARVRYLLYKKGLEKDDAQAFQWFRRAADLGHVTAMNTCGYCYAHGVGVAKNVLRAMIRRSTSPRMNPLTRRGPGRVLKSN